MYFQCTFLEVLATQDQLHSMYYHYTIYFMAEDRDINDIYLHRELNPGV